MACPSTGQGYGNPLVASDDEGPRRRGEGLRRRRGLCQGQARSQRESDARAVGHQHTSARARQSLLRRLLQSQPLGTGRENDRAKDRLSSIDLAGRSESDQSKVGRCSSAAVLRSVPACRRPAALRLVRTLCDCRCIEGSAHFHRDARFLSSLDGRRCMLRFMIALVIGLVASVSGVTAASAQTYPQRPVKFILPFGPAAGTDITARLLGEKLAARWGKPVVIENRPGGDGLVAINAFTSANDEHTLLFVPASTFTAHPY